MVAKDSRTPRQGCLGRHLVAEFLGCDPTSLEQVSFLKEHAALACRLAGATVLSVHGHKFSPQGATAMVILAESHLSIHTWPEHGYAAVDVYTCGPGMRPEEAVRHLAHCLRAQRQAVLALSRGRFASNGNGQLRFRPDVLHCSGVGIQGGNGRPQPGAGAKGAAAG